MHDSDITVTPDAEKKYTEEYGDLYVAAQARTRAAIGKSIASLFELPKRSGTEKKQAKRAETAKIKTEILFIERCLSLLNPGGRLGIVLPEGIFNNPSLAYVREFCENRKTLQRELADYQKRMNDRIATEARASLKNRFPYPIFLYEAEKGGITATGEQDQNELYPNDNLPPGVTQTSVELYQAFKQDPTPFFIGGGGEMTVAADTKQRAFAVWWSALGKWDIASTWLHSGLKI